MIGPMLRKAMLAGGSCTATSAPDAPYDLTSSGVTSSSITLNWEDATSTPNEASSYEVGISSNGGTTWTTVTVSAPASLYTFTSLSAGTTYDFRIRGVNCFGTGSYDGEAFTQATSVGTLSPSWSLDFSSGTPSGYTLTRASSGTFIDSSGYVASQASGTSGNSAARLTHNSSGSRLGLLVEEQRTNLAQYSEDFANAYWTKLALTIDDNGGSYWTSPANTSDAVLLEQVSGTSSKHILRQFTSVTNICFSIFAKKQTTSGVGRYIYIVLRGASSDYAAAVFDLDQGTVSQSSNVGSTWSSVADGIEDYGNGWYRCHIRGTRSSGTTNVYVGLANSGTPTMSNTGQSYNGANSTDGVYAWGAMFEAVNGPPTSYIETPSNANVTRSADLAHVLDSAITDWGWGALVIHFYPPGQAGTLISTDDASASQYGIQADTSTSARGFWQTGQTTSATLGTGIQKAAHFISGSTSKFVLNGGTVYSATNDVTHSNIDFVTLGAEATDSSGVPGTFSQWANCVIRKIEWYGDGNLTNAQLQAITT
jgi:hypothetical protein